MRTSVFYIVGTTGLALALLFAFGAGAVWNHLIKRRRTLTDAETPSAAFDPDRRETCLPSC